MVRAVLDLQPRAKYICGCNTLLNACVGQITSPQRMIRSLVMIRYGPATAILTNLFFKLSCSWQQIRIRKKSRRFLVLNCRILGLALLRIQMAAAEKPLFNTAVVNAKYMLNSKLLVQSESTDLCSWFTLD